jgi:RNA polymerase sigma factor (sigma-70 family)
MTDARRTPDGPLSVAARHAVIAEFLAASPTPSALLRFRFPGLVRRVSAAGMGDELDAACLYGLVKAAAKFDPGRGCAFGTYALPWMRQTCERLLGRHVRDWRRRGERRLVSGDAPVGADGDASLFGLLAGAAADPADRAAVAEVGRRVRAAVRRHVAGATRRYVLELRYGLLDGVTRTLDEVAEVLGTSRERVRQIEASGTDRLRPHLAGLLANGEGVRG